VARSNSGVRAAIVDFHQTLARIKRTSAPGGSRQSEKVRNLHWVCLSRQALAIFVALSNRAAGSRVVLPWCQDFTRCMLMGARMCQSWCRRTYQSRCSAWLCEGARDDLNGIAVGGQRDLFRLLKNHLALAVVYEYVILSTMDAQNPGKLNRLLAGLGDTRLVSSRWLRAHGYSNSLVARYVGSGWLVSPARGVYLRRGGRLQWEGVVRSLQVGEGMPLHVGGRFALGLQGHEHYLRLGDAGTITLYGSVRLPGWVGKLSMEQHFEYLGKGAFDLPAVPFTDEVPEKVLSDLGLAWHRAGPGTDALVCSVPERAMLELCDGVSDAAGVYEADALMQAMTTLRPQRIGLLLRRCRSIKAKRLFLALADRHRHAWLTHVPLEDVDLGRGKRALVSGGRLHPTYLITLPGDLDEHLA